MTDEELFEFIKKQEEELLKKPSFYAHYDATSGQIISFRNYFESTDTLPFVEFTEKDLDIPLDKFNIANYRVLTIEGKTKLEKYIPEDLSLKRIDDFIYEIPKIKSDKRITYADQHYDLLIEQNNPLEEFKVKLSKPLRDKFTIQGVSKQVMSIYVTAPSDPNILYKTLNFTLGDLVRNEYVTIKFNYYSTDKIRRPDRFAGGEANIYATKYFQDYLHVDIR